MNTILINKENASTRELEPLTENVIYSDNEEEQTEQTNEEYTKVNNFITEVNDPKEESDQEYYKTEFRRNNRLATNRPTIDNNEKIGNLVKVSSERKIISAIPKKESNISHLKGTFNNEKIIKSKKSVRSNKSKSTRGDVVTRPSTAYVGASRLTSRQDRRLTSAKDSAFSSQGRLIVKKKRPKTGIRQNISIPILPKWAKSIDEAKESKSFKNYKSLGACIKKCERALSTSRLELKQMKRQHKDLGNNLVDFVETLEETKEVCRLSNKYTQSCVKQFRRDKCAFIYGKKMDEAHYIINKKKSIYNTIERISKLNPKYINMVEEMMKEVEQKEDNLLLL